MFDSPLSASAYEILGVEPDVEHEELRRAYRLRLRQTHPDTGGDAAVFGHSSGAILALYAASLGVPISALFLSEPPFRYGEDEPAEQKLSSGKSVHHDLTFLGVRFQ